MEIKQRDVNGIMILDFSGNLDTNTAPGTEFIIDYNNVIDHAYCYDRAKINTPTTSRTLIRIYFDHTSPLFFGIYLKIYD